jgi:hypothetical protein
MDRLVGRNLSNMINSFFGGGKKGASKEEKETDRRSSARRAVNFCFAAGGAA